MNRNDRNIAIGACLVAIIALVAVLLAGNGTVEKKEERTEQVDRRQYASQQKHQKRYKPYATTARRVETFPFDPNTADSTQLLRLGLQPWQVRNIYKYRAAGGIYRTKEDFARVYGLTVKDYRRLEPYIRISSDYLPAATLVGERSYGAYGANKAHGTDGANGPDGQEPYPRKIDSTQHIVLNTADTTQLKRVPGIGSYYAKEIVRHGKWLGGYVSVDQLDEIDGFPQEAKKYLTIEHATPQRLNINKLSLQQLRRHPYINYYQAKAITDYRRLHGDIHSLQELRFSRDFTPEAIKRLEPYITFQ